MELILRFVVEGSGELLLVGMYSALGEVVGNDRWVGEP